MVHDEDPTIGKKRNNKNAMTFAKYHGNGNDFIIIDAVKKEHKSFVQKAPALCDRKRGIGADGLLLIATENDRLAMTVVNSDGSEAQNCGNGLRCAARWFFDAHPSERSVFIDLGQRTYACEKKDELILVEMGACLIKEKSELYFASLDKEARVFEVFLGNEHVIFMFNHQVYSDSFPSLVAEAKEKVADWRRYNLGFLFVYDDIFKSFVWERGAGFTQSCGTSACAAAAAVVIKQAPQVRDEIVITQPGGEILVRTHVLEKLGREAKVSILQLGCAESVFSGIWPEGNPGACLFTS